MTKERNSEPEDSAGSDPKPKLKVTDRRMFDAQGNPRQPDIDDAAPQREDSPETETSSAAEPATAEPLATDSEATAAAPEPESAAADAEAPASEPAGVTPDPADTEAEGASFADLPRDFSAFVESQYLEALIFLGAVPHPQSGETIEDPAFAGYKIDLLAMLQEKTEGNLTEQEARLIEDVLYQLRMLYVQKTKGAQT
jgi:hypothetical protein